MTLARTWPLVLLNFLLIGKTDVSKSAESLDCPEPPVNATSGENVTMQCRVPKLQSPVQRVDWVVNDTKDVYGYRKGEYFCDSCGEYKGRTTLFLDELTKGNCSLKLTSVRMSDTGKYRCSVRVGPTTKQAFCFVCLSVNPTQLRSLDPDQHQEIATPSESLRPEGPVGEISDIIVLVLCPVIFVAMLVGCVIWKKCKKKEVRTS